VPIIVCHDEIVVECDVEQADAAKAWLEKAMTEGMDTILNGLSEVQMPIAAESRINNSWAQY
jgi:DNA polymerase I-like protein with 3'-5' exonuclease and polymerase domains